MIEAYPLSWPADRPRTSRYDRKAGPSQMPGGRVRQLLTKELKMMEVDQIVISTNVATRRDGLPYAGQREPEDPGVVLYFTRKGSDIAISCDRWRTVDANLRAIGLTVEAIRGMERWGTEEMIDRAFTGFKALPSAIVTPPPSDRVKRPWWVVLGTTQDADAPTVKQAYRRAQATAHPDAGGSNYDFQEVQAAYDEWKAQ